jgi:hypothetical protein
MAALSLALAPSLATAQELPGPSDVAVFTGVAPISPGGTCPGAVCWVGGTGSYTFASSACVNVSEIDSLSDNPLAEVDTNCHVTAGGNFDNVVCGTGYANGNATVAAEGETGTFSFSIVFAGTVGIITGAGSESDSGPAWLVGVVQISGTPVAPTPTPPNFGPCVNTFTPTVVAAIFDGAAPPLPLVGCPIPDPDDVVTDGIGGWPLADPFGCLSPVIP